MADIIKLLPDSVANQIAAGEVIQRPSSVVKELMENSVDAGSANVTILIRDSGKTLIQVIDDGTGMSETDARLSFERHATSKITSANDLFAIKTKGFRGEALASIAAVSMVELKTRKKDNETGTLISISGSKVELQEPCSTPPGSSFSVKNLFFNIPARRKFLKSDNTELRHIITEFQKVVLAHPELRFSLYHNDNEIYNLTPGNIRQRIVGVFGKLINNNLITLDTQTTLITIRGFIGKPENARRSFGEQFFFVNNRFMKHPYFHKALMEAYQNILPNDAIPAYFIFMETDPASIDINIHPTKTEIKFEDERAIWQILTASVREALGRFNIIPSLDFGNESLIEIPVRTKEHGIPDPPVIEVNKNYDPFSSDTYPGNRKNLFTNFEKENSYEWQKLYSALENETSVPTEQLAERKLIQIKNKYILCPVKSGLMIIDQKRAHERILFEIYLERLNNNRGTTQTELFPVEFELNPADLLILNEIEDYLRLLGFNFVPVDNNRIKVTGYPSEISMGNPLEMIEILLGQYKISKSDPATGIRENMPKQLTNQISKRLYESTIRDVLLQLIELSRRKEASALRYGHLKLVDQSRLTDTRMP